MHPLAFKDKLHPCDYKDNQEKDDRHGACSIKTGVIESFFINLKNQHVGGVVGPTVRKEPHLGEGLEGGDDVVKHHKENLRRGKRNDNFANARAIAGTVNFGTFQKLHRYIAKSRQQENNIKPQVCPNRDGCNTPDGKLRAAEPVHGKRRTDS